MSRKAKPPKRPMSANQASLAMSILTQIDAGELSSFKLTIERKMNLTPAKLWALLQYQPLRGVVLGDTEYPLGFWWDMDWYLPDEDLARIYGFGALVGFVSRRRDYQFAARWAYVNGQAPDDAEYRQAINNEQARARRFGITT